SAGVMTSITARPILTEEFTTQFNLENINFLSNERLEERLLEVSGTPEQAAEAMAVNEEARLRALKIAFVVLGSLSLLAIFPCGRLPEHRPGEVPVETPVDPEELKKLKD